MTQLEQLTAFVFVVEAGGFNEAARTGIGRKGTLSQRVRELEKRLGVPLLARASRTLCLTDEGRAYYEHARRAVSAARDAESVVLQAKAEPTGTLSVSTTPSLASRALEISVFRYLSRHPQVAVQLDVSDARPDLVRGEFDLAIRPAEPHDAALVARELGALQRGYFVSPEYFVRRGLPAHPEQLAAHDTIVHAVAGTTQAWSFIIDGHACRLQLRPRLVLPSEALALEAAAAGFGVARLPLALAAPYVNARQLVAVLREHTPPASSVYAVYAVAAGLVPKTRAFLEVLAAAYREQSD